MNLYHYGTKKESKRLKNYPTENKFYSWDDNGFQQTEKFEQNMLHRR